MMENSIAIIEVRERPSPEKINQQLEDNQRNLETSEDASRWKSLYTILILAACIANIAVMTSFPRKNSIFFPEYWYETIILVVVAVCFRQSFSHILGLFIFTKERCLLTRFHFTKVFLTSSTVFVVSYCISYYTWTWYLGYNHPMPLMAITILLADITIYKIAFWFFFPMELRYRDGLRQQCTIYLIWRICVTLHVVPNEILSKISKTDSFLQYTLPLLIPFFRDLSSWVAKKIVQISPGTNNEATKFLVTASIHLSYTKFVTAKLHTLPQSMVFGILIVETLMHIKGCYEIFTLTKRIQEVHRTTGIDATISRRKNKVQSLAMNEFVDAMLPLVFGIAFAMAYYGPNAAMIKGVKNEDFGDKVGDIQHIYFTMVLMFSFDLFAMTISVMFLRRFCNINLFQEFCNMIDKYWLIFLVKLPGITMAFGQRDVNLGWDYSGKFLWTTDEGRLNMICNSVHISEEEKSFLMMNSTQCQTSIN